MPVLSCNRCGTETGDHGPGIRFWGSSFVAGPQGEIVAQAPPDEASVLVAELDLQRSERTRQIWPFLRDRRIDAYSDLVKRFRDRTA